MKIGLTGGIASGKNYVAKLFEEKGCHTLDADQVARLVIEPNGLAYDAVVQAFGEYILDSDGIISRKALREAVVDNPERLKQLEQLVHPAVSEYSRRWSGEILGRDSKAILIYHAPLLIEASQQWQYDSLILIYCSESTQLARLRQRGYPPYEDAIKLMQNQMPYAEKLQYANFVLDNDSSEENARAEVARVYELLELMRYGDKHKFY
jgi:dephospho-CoA kinase